MTKMTYVDAIDVAIEAVTDEEVVEKLTALKAQIAKKHTSSKSKATAETEARAEKVYNALVEMTKPVTITELMKLTTDTEVADYSNQRITALLRKLGDRVICEKVKGKSYYTVA